MTYKIKRKKRGDYYGTYRTGKSTFKYNKSLYARGKKNRTIDKKKIHYAIVKNGKVLEFQKLPKPISYYIKNGFSVSKVTPSGNTTKVETFSPRTKQQALEVERAVISIRPSKKGVMLK